MPSFVCNSCSENKFIAQFEITKVVPTFELSTDTVTMYDEESKTVTVTYSGDGTLGAESNDTNLVTASVEGKTITLTGVNGNNAKIFNNLIA